MSTGQLQIVVKQATQRTGEFPGGGYIEYTISTVSNHPAFPPGYFLCERRYSDFNWLREELGLSYPGCIIPPIPDKQMLGTLDTQFVESRKRGLQKFLNRIASHPTLSEARQFVKFLTSNDDAFSIECVATEVKKQTAMKDTVVSWWDTAYYAVYDTVSGTKPVEEAKVEEHYSETEIASLTQYVERLDGAVKKMLETSNKYIATTEKFAYSKNVFGESFLALSGRENGLAAAMFGQIGKRSTTDGENATSMLTNTVEHFMEPLKEFSKTIESARETLARRIEKKSIYVSAVTELNLLSGRDDGSDPSKKQEAIAKAKKLIESTRIEYETVSLSFIQEFIKFKAESSLDMHKAMFALAQLQTEFQKKTAESWKEYEEHQYVAVPLSSSDTSNCVLS